MSGWFSMKRGITSHPIFKGNPERIAIWVWLLDNAVWRDTPHDVKGKTITVPRGSVCTSERRIAEKVGVGYQVVRTFLRRLKSEHMINAKVTHGKNIITLCNWDKYQNVNSDDNAKGNATLTHDQRIKEQENKKEKEEPIGSSKKKVSSQRKSRLPEDWRLPQEWADWAIAKGMAQSVVLQEAEKFKDHHRGRGNLMLDWRCAWQNWTRKHLEFEKQRSKQSKSSDQDYIRTLPDGRRQIRDSFYGWMNLVE